MKLQHRFAAGAAAVVCLAANHKLSVAQPIPVPLDDRDPSSTPGVVDFSDLPPLPLADTTSTNATVLAATYADEDVVVGAAKREQTLGNVASAVTVVTRDRIRRFGYRTVAEAVAGVAGVFISDDRLQQRMGIRGFQLLGDFNTRILVLVDGASVNEGWGSLSGVGYDSPVSIDEIARIEIIRGPVSSLYGTSAFFGIVNIVTRSAAESPKAWARFGGGNVGGGTFAAGFARGDVHRQIRATVSGMGRLGETLAVPEIGNSLQHDASQQLAASVVATYDGWFGQLRAYRFRRESPFAPYDADPGIGYTSFNSQVAFEGGHVRSLSKRLALSVRGYASVYRFNDDVPKIVEQSKLETIGDSQMAGAEARVRYDIASKNRLSVTAGFETTLHRTRSRAAFTPPVAGQSATNIPVNFNVEGTYLEFDGTPVRGIGFTAGLRFDRHSLLENRVSPRVALFLAKQEKFGAKFIYAEGFRNPSMFEGFFDDGQDYRANPNIRAEVIRSGEVVLWARPVSGLSLRVSGYQWRPQRIVEQRPIGPGLDQFQNVGTYVSTGIESEASYRNASGWFGFGGASYTRVRDGSGAKVPNAPDILATGGISSPLIWRLFHASVDTTFVGQRPTTLANTVAQPYLLLGATLFLPSWRKFDFTLSGRNLLGTRPQIVAPQDYDRTVPSEVTVARVPGEGREVILRVGYEFR